MTKPFDYGNLPYEYLTEANYHLRFQNQISDFRKRVHFRQCELRVLITKTCVETPISMFDFESRLKLSKQFQNKKFSKVRIKNRCVLSTRSCTIRGFRISRIYFRTLANLGQLPGVSKRINR